MIRHIDSLSGFLNDKQLIAWSLTPGAIILLIIFIYTEIEQTLDISIMNYNQNSLPLSVTFYIIFFS